MDLMERLNYLYPDRTMTFEKFDLWLHSAQEQHDRLAAQGIGDEAIENTNVVAKMIGDYPFYEALDLFPRLSKDDDTLLTEKVWQGLVRRGVDNDPAYTERAFKEEMPVIISKGFSSYMLAVEDLVDFARRKKIRVGPGRGSAAGSVVCWALGITQPDPVKNNLLFFRFLDPSRNDYPDVDIDFQANRRDEVQAYAVKKYTHVARIATFGTFKGKSAVKAVASAL